jgi:DNA-3-methyladenine glycosylase I
VRKKWKKIKKIFSNFSISKIANYGFEEIESLMKNPHAIRNEKKIRAIVENAREFQEIIAEYGSFREFLRVLKKSPKKKRIKELTKRFKHFGKYSAEYFLHSVGE